MHTLLLVPSSGTFFPDSNLRCLVLLPALQSIGMDEDSGALQSTPFWMGANGDSSRRRLMVECPLSGEL